MFLWLWRPKLTLRYNQRCAKPLKFKGILKRGFCNNLKMSWCLRVGFQLLCNVQLAGTAWVLSKEEPPQQRWPGDITGWVSMDWDVGLKPFLELKKALCSFIFWIHMRKKPLVFFISRMGSSENSSPVTSAWDQTAQSLRLPLCTKPPSCVLHLSVPA